MSFKMILKWFGPCYVRFLEDCAVRLMDVNKDVRESYQQLIRALPTDLLTRFVPLCLSCLAKESLFSLK